MQAEPDAAPVAAARHDAAPAEGCTTGDAGTPSPTAALDARVIGAIRAGDGAQLKLLAGPSLDVARVPTSTSLAPETPYLGCQAREGGFIARYGGADNGIHELQLHWTWRHERWELDGVFKFGW